MVHVDEDASISINVVANDSDPESDVLGLKSVMAPAHGAAEIVDAKSIRYTPS